MMQKALTNNIELTKMDKETIRKDEVEAALELAETL